jgi:hypothetical protein
LQRRARIRQERMEPLLPLFERVRADGFAIELEEVEQKEDQVFRVARVRRGLEEAERGCAILLNAAQLPVEIGLPKAG